MWVDQNNKTRDLKQQLASAKEEISSHLKALDVQRIDMINKSKNCWIKFTDLKVRLSS